MAEPVPGAATILVIDDDTATRRLLARQLQIMGGFQVVLAESGMAGVALAEEVAPEVILLDVDMPDMDGYETCSKLKSQFSTADIPVILVTGAHRTSKAVVRGFEAGANDFMSKPVSRVDLFARVHVVLREQALREDYRRLATQDPMTGLANRRQFFLATTQALVRLRRRGGGELVLILADLDKFKQVNDAYGHDFGDEVIVTFSRILKRCTSRTCHAGRLGGEEFALVVSQETRDEGISLANRLRETFAAVEFDADTEPKHFTASFGVASYDGQSGDLDFDLLLKQADIALYAAKKAGRNRVTAYWNLDQDEQLAVPAAQQHARSGKRAKTHRSFVGVVDRAEADTPTPQAPAQDALEQR